MKTIIVYLSAITFSWAQTTDETLPFRELTLPTTSYTSGAVTSRFIDGLGFRFYWATEGLRDEDLAFKPGGDSRTSLETIQHIHEMSFIIVNVAKGIPTQAIDNEGKSFSQLRREALQNFKQASDLIKAWSESDFEKHEMIFKGESSSSAFPFWNLVNGPLSDCIWHIGQLVTFRRSSGNPFTTDVSLLAGKLRNK